jgi:hypothetical protein
MVVVSRMRTGVWKTEFKTDENGEKKLRRARTPKTPGHEVILWNENDFESEKEKWGSYSESYLAFERNRDFDGVVALIEPDRMLRPEEEGSPYPVFLDIDDCRDPETGEITLPWVRDLLERLGTYAEVSPSGKGIRIVGWARRDPRSKTDLKEVAERLGEGLTFRSTALRGASPHHDHGLPPPRVRRSDPGHPGLGGRGRPPPRAALGERGVHRSRPFRHRGRGSEAEDALLGRRGPHEEVLRRRRDSLEGAGEQVRTAPRPTWASSRGWPGGPVTTGSG